MHVSLSPTIPSGAEESAAERLAIPCLPMARHRLHLRAETPVRLPAYAGSAWRGVLGHALKRTVCVTREPTCPGCLLYRSCVYPYVFETPPPVDAAKLRKYPAAPHPFVVEPWPDCRDVAPDEAFGVDLVLLGRGRAQLPYFIEALRRAGETGIGAGAATGTGHYVLEAVAQQSAGDWVEIYRPGAGLEAMHEPTAAAPPVPTGGTLQIVLLTPLRLKVANDLVTTDRLRFRDFFSHLLRRASLLSYFHTDTPLETDFRGLVQAAQAIDWQAAELRWQDWTRYSSRQDALLQMGGLVGTLTLPTAGLEAFWPYLWLGQWTHVGKAAVMGLGRYRLSAA
jgi:hypothetical protein